MLESAAGDPDSFEPQRLLQLAHHLGYEQRVLGAYLLVLAQGTLSEWRRKAIDELLPQVVDLARYESTTGATVGPLVARRKDQAKRLLDASAPRERIDHAGDAYVLANDPDELARHARLVEPLPRKGTMRVAVTPMGEPHHWQVDVACRDDLGSLTRLTTCLTDHGLDILQANVATWPDGGAVFSFVVEGSLRPSARELAEAFEDDSRTPLVPAELVDLEMTVDNAALPWHTSVVVSCTDAPGVLSTVAAAFAASGVVVADARIVSAEGRVTDRFALTDRRGRKLDDATIARLRSVLETGVKRRRVRRLIGA